MVFEDASSVDTKEIIYVASSDYIYACLFNINDQGYLVSSLVWFDVGIYIEW